jgi:hypothetical protein
LEELAQNGARREAASIHLGVRAAPFALEAENLV